MITIGAADLNAWLAAFFYPFFRIAALASTAPLLSHPSVPRQARVALALLMTVLVAPTLPAVAPISPFSTVGLILIVEQVLAGMALGFTMQIAFAAVELAGDVIGLQMGLSFAAFIDPQNSEQTPLIGGFFSLTLMLVFTAINGHLLLLGALIDSFRAFPMSVEGVHWYDWQRLASAGSQLFAAGLQIALPVIGAMMLANLALGVLTRTAPQLNLFAVGFPVTLAVGLLMLLLGLPYLMPMLESVVYGGLEVLTR